jgi:ketosteroid isomerase-like protein
LLRLGGIGVVPLRCTRIAAAFRSIAAQALNKRQAALQRGSIVEEEPMRRPVIALSFLLCLSCARQPDAEAIRDAIAGIAAAVEAHRNANVLERISEDFIGNDELDRTQLDKLLRLQMIAANSIGVSVGGIQVDVQGDRATASFEARVTDSSGRWIADRSATLKFETGWRREHDKWRCYNAKWVQQG